MAKRAKKRKSAARRTSRPQKKLSDLFHETLKEVESEFPTHRESFTQYVFARCRSLAYASALANDTLLHRTAIGLLGDRREQLGVRGRAWLVLATDVRLCVFLARLSEGIGLAQRIQRRMFSRELVPSVVRRFSAWWRRGA